MLLLPFRMSNSTQVARRAGIVALGTLGSRALGMLRESVIAASFSVVATDAFFIAFTIPNTLRMLLGEGAVSGAFVPVFSEVRTQRGHDAARVFSERFTGTLAALLLLATLLGILAAPLLAWAYAGGLAEVPESFALVVSLTRWLFPFLLLAGLGALATGLLNVLGHYAVPAFAPALLNVAMIASPFVLAPLALWLDAPSILTLAFGALLGGVLQLLVQVPALKKQGMLPRPRLGFRDPDVRRGLALMGPLVLGLGVYQLNMMLSRLFTSFLPTGSQSYLNYGQRVIEVPQGMSHSRWPRRPCPRSRACAAKESATSCSPCFATRCA
jgi:putative peptidoglycan lipid II flippase